MIIRELNRESNQCKQTIKTLPVFLSRALKGVQIRFLQGGGGDNKSNFTKICNLTSLGGMIFN